MEQVTAKFFCRKKNQPKSTKTEANNDGNTGTSRSERSQGQGTDTFNLMQPYLGDWQ